MKPILILDGGLGTSLEQKYKIRFGPSTPLWSSDLLVSDPETLLRCQADFARVPVDIILTATYQVSIEGFAGTRTAQFPDGIPACQIPSYVSKAVDVATEAAASAAAAAKSAIVALSLGPYGACMVPSQEYSGRYDADHDSEEQLLAWHSQRLRLFSHVADRIGMIALETIPRVDEVAALRRALDSVPQLRRVPFWMSCLFPGEGEGRLPAGGGGGGQAKQQGLEEALRTMFDADVAACRPWAVGINCTEVSKLASLLARYETCIGDMVRRGTLSAWPALVLYPDGTRGQVYNTATQTWDVTTVGGAAERAPWEETLAQAVRATRKRGRWEQIVVGGCCMASCQDISRLRRLLLCTITDDDDLPT